jgi:transposase
MVACWRWHPVRHYPFLLALYADADYQRPQFQGALLRVVREGQRGDRQAIRRGEGVLRSAQRWIAERTIGWLNRCRRLAKDWECLNRSALAFLRWSSFD